MTHRKPLPSWVIVSFFVIGLLSATAFRILIAFQYLAPGLFRPVWYFGVLGYLSFFLYRFLITERRRHAISENRLIEKMQANQSLEEEDKENILYVLKSISSSRENWNYLAIFILSLGAIVLDLVLASGILS